MKAFTALLLIYCRDSYVELHLDQFVDLLDPENQPSMPLTLILNISILNFFYRPQGACCDAAHYSQEGSHRGE